MNGLTLRELAKAHLEPLPGRTVYTGALPDGPLPARYVIVWSSEGSEESTRAARTVNIQTPALWVTSVSRNGDPMVAEREASWGAAEARRRLRNWRPEARWALTHELSQPARRDESIPETTYVAVEQYTLRSSI